MEKIEIDDLITVESGEKYLVVDSFDFKDKHYLYLISDDGKNSTLIVRYIDNCIEKLDSQEEYDAVLKELISRNKDEIDKLMEGVNEN